MKCFRHNDAEAIGICTHCGKGLCTFCVVDLGFGLACIDSCHDAVRALYQKKISDDFGQYISAGILFGIACAFFLWSTMVPTNSWLKMSLVSASIFSIIGFLLMTKLCLQRSKRLAPFEIEKGKHLARKIEEQKILDESLEREFIDMERSSSDQEA